jgi:hypothetical protein
VTTTAGAPLPPSGLTALQKLDDAFARLRGPSHDDLRRVAPCGKPPRRMLPVDPTWAEAAEVEASGADLKLPETLWAMAAAEQDRRHHRMPTGHDWCRGRTDCRGKRTWAGVPSLADRLAECGGGAKQAFRRSGRPPPRSGPAVAMLTVEPPGHDESLSTLGRTAAPRRCPMVARTRA